MVLGYHISDNISQNLAHRNPLPSSFKMDKLSAVSVVAAAIVLLSWHIRTNVALLLAIYKAAKTSQVSHDKLESLQEMKHKINAALEMHNLASLATSSPDVLGTLDALRDMLNEIAPLIPDEIELAGTRGEFVLPEGAEQRLCSLIFELSHQLSRLIDALPSFICDPAYVLLH